MAKMLLVVCLSIIASEVKAGTETFLPAGTSPAEEGHLNHHQHSNEVGHHPASTEHLDAPQHHRVRRQFVDLSLNHHKNGAPRPVGKPHFLLNANGSGNRKNHDINVNAGVGAVVWRSRNDKHSLGVGASVDQSRRRFQGVSVTTKPNIGVGVGYKFQFG